MAEKLKLALETKCVFSMPIVGSMAAATAMNSVMMGLFAKQSTAQCFPNHEAALQCLSTLASESVMETYPKEWDSVGELIVTLKAHPNSKELVEGSVFEHFLNNSIDIHMLNAIRVQLFLHIAVNLGTQIFMMGDGSTKASGTYLPGLVVSMLQDLLRQFNMADPTCRSNFPQQFIDMHDRHRSRDVGWGLVLAEIIKQSVLIDKFCADNDHASLQTRLASAKSPKKDWPSIIDEYGCSAFF